jgi:hypothetical protein
MHRVQGETDTVGGKKLGYEELMDWKYRTPQGQSWGGIIQEYHIAFAKRDCPLPNEHGEVPVPIHRPAERNITDLQPSVFRDTVLRDGAEPNPLLLLERPQVTYEEIVPTDSYDVIGWYDPDGGDASSRVKPAEKIPHRFPDLVGVDYTKSTAITLPSVGVHVPWDGMNGDDTKFVRNAPSEYGDADYEITTPNVTSEFHITAGHAHGYPRFLIDSPFDAKDDIKNLNADTRWDSENSQWTVEKSIGALNEMVQVFSDAGWEFTIDADIIESYGDKKISVTPDEYVEMDVSDILTAAFTEEITVGTGINVPGLDVDIQTDDDTRLVEISDDDGLTVDTVTENGANHIKSVFDGRVAFDCPKSNAGLVKSLDWKESKYEWSNKHGGWLINQDSVADLIAVFVGNGESMTAAIGALAGIGNQERLTETREMDVDSDAAVGLTEYESPAFQDVHIDGDIDITIGEDVNPRTSVLGLHADDPDSLSLLSLDLTLADTGDAGMSVQISGGSLDEVPANVASVWQPSMKMDDDVYSWYNPKTSARIEVEEIEGWGTEYAVSIEEHWMDEPEHVVTLADERMVVQTVITHLKSMNK